MNPVVFSLSAPRYSIKFTEVENPREFEFVSRLRMTEINKVASLIEGRVFQNGELYIDLLVRPHLMPQGGEFSEHERAVLNAAGKTDKHGSTHLCEIVKRLLSSGRITTQTTVRLHPTADIMVGGNQERLVSYYQNLSFSVDPAHRHEMITTVERFISRCDSGMQAVVFTLPGGS